MPTTRGGGGGVFLLCLSSQVPDDRVIADRKAKPREEALRGETAEGLAQMGDDLVVTESTATVVCKDSLVGFGKSATVASAVQAPPPPKSNLVLHRAPSNREILKCPAMPAVGPRRSSTQAGQQPSGRRSSSSTS